MNQLLDRMGSLESRVNHLSETTAANTVAISGLHTAIDAFRENIDRVLEYNTHEMETLEGRLLQMIGKNHMEVVALGDIANEIRKGQQKLIAWAIAVWTVAQFAMPMLMKYLQKPGI